MFTEQDFEAAKYADKQGWDISRVSNVTRLSNNEPWYAISTNNKYYAKGATLHEAVEKLKAILNPPTITKDEIIGKILKIKIHLTDPLWDECDRFIARLSKSKVVE